MISAILTIADGFLLLYLLFVLLLFLFFMEIKMFEQHFHCFYKDGISHHSVLSPAAVIITHLCSLICLMYVNEKYTIYEIPLMMTDDHTQKSYQFFVLNPPFLHGIENRAHGFTDRAQSILHMRRHLRINGSCDDTILFH